MTRHSICLNGAHIVVPRNADSVRQLAGQELQRFLYLLTGVESPVGDHSPHRGVTIALGVKSPSQLGVENTEWSLGRDGFVIRVHGKEQASAIHLAAASSRGLLNGVYTLLEDLGVGFYLGGETLPDRRISAILPGGYQRTEKPAFAVRGQLFHDNALIGITGWGESDYRAYFNQIVRLRCNTVLLQWYCDNSAEVWHEGNGRLLNATPVMSTLTNPWGALKALRTSQFCFGTGEYFDEEVFGHPALQTQRDPMAQRREITRALASAITMARAGGLDVATGFVVPVGDVNHPMDPTDRRVREAFQRRVRSFLERNPHLGYFVLTNHESGGCCGTKLPADNPRASRLFKSQYPIFAYLGNSRRVWEAIRFGRFAQLAWDVLRQEAPRLKLVLNGWGGDRWMRFADYYPGYDKILPPDVIFACFDNIQSTLSDTVSAVWGELPAARERWAIPWIENDNSDFWTPQPNVIGLRELANDALQKGCQGLAVMTWRARDFEEEVGFAARFAWETGLTVEDFYRRLARDTFGAEHAGRMSRHLLTLQRLGKRWSGVDGTKEIAEMNFAGCRPHLPFELGPEAVRFLLPFARDAAKKLMEPYSDDLVLSNLADELLVSHKPEVSSGKTAPGKKSAEIGVREFHEIVRLLNGLMRTRSPKRIREVLNRTVEMVFGVRDKLIRRGLTPRQFCAMDIYWSHAHQLAYFAGARGKMAKLDRIADDIRKLRRTFVARNQIGRLDRIDYLLANLDFVRHYDRVAMLLADGEEMETAIRRARNLLKKGSRTVARAIAASAYEKLIKAGMREALLALTNKLSTQCEWGILAAVNIKPVPKYFEFIGELESLMPAAPPRQLHAQLNGNDVHLWWDTPMKAEGAAEFEDGNETQRLRGKHAVCCHVYRQEGDNGRARRLTKLPLPSNLPVFVDRPGLDGQYVYWVTCLAGDGWESPPSHAVKIAVGRAAKPLRIIVRRPVSVLAANEPLEVRAVVAGDYSGQQVFLHYRFGKERLWTSVEMQRRFRRSYHAVIPAEMVRPGLLKFWIEAGKPGGSRSSWPLTAHAGRPWTVSVIKCRLP